MIIEKTKKENLKRIWRLPLTYTMKKHLHRHDFVIISSNCVGGVLLHDLGEEFCTPTINLIIPEFVSFCENLVEYLHIEPRLAETQNQKYPVFVIGNIEIHGIHYKTSEEFLSAWERRTRRFFNKVDSGAEIIIMAADTQLKEENATERFHRLNYRKVAFSAGDVVYPEFVRIPEFEGENHVGDLTKFADAVGRRYFEKYFDCVKFINGYGDL